MNKITVIQPTIQPLFKQLVTGLPADVHHTTTLRPPHNQQVFLPILKLTNRPTSSTTNNATTSMHISISPYFKSYPRRFHQSSPGHRCQPKLSSPPPPVRAILNTSTRKNPCNHSQAEAIFAPRQRNPNTIQKELSLTLAPNQSSPPPPVRAILALAVHQSNPRTRRRKKLSSMHLPKQSSPLLPSKVTVDAAITKAIVNGLAPLA